MACRHCGGSCKNDTEHFANMRGGWVTPGPVSNISNIVSNKVDIVSNGVSNRLNDWRDKNREKYNAYQRDLMREKRRKLKYDSEEDGT